MEMWKIIITLYTWGAVLWAIVLHLNQFMVIYEQVDVADVLTMRHGLMQKNIYTFESTNRD